MQIEYSKKPRDARRWLQSRSMDECKERGLSAA